MSDTSEITHYWQGGRKIPVEADPDALQLSAESETFALNYLDKLGFEPSSIASLGTSSFEVVTRRTAQTAINALQRGGFEADSRLVHADNPSEAPQSDGTFFLTLKEGVAAEQARELIAARGLEQVDALDERTFLVRPKAGRNVFRTSNRLAGESLVESAEPNLVRNLVRFSPDPLQPRQWHLEAPRAGSALAARAGIQARRAWEITRGDREVVVAVMDDGFDLTHPDLTGQGKIVGRLNVRLANPGVKFDEHVLPRPGDYHGTPCAGVAVAEHNGLGTVGVAPNCALLAVRFPLNISDYHLAKVFQHVSTKAHIVSCSWGVGPANAPMSSALKRTIATLTRNGGPDGRGLTFCVAAGNNNCPIKDLDNTNTYEFMDGLGLLRTHSGPIDRWIASHPDAITVSACSSMKRRSAYSSWGEEIDVCAPSDNWDDLRRVEVSGRGVVTIDNEGFGHGSDFTKGSRYTADFGGTSSATPTVAGICGLVKSATPALNAGEIKAIIQDTADKDLSMVSETPVNRPGTFGADGHSLWFGHGKVNAGRAVERAKEGR